MNEPMKAAYVFPGQGSQSVGMGRDLYESSRAARAVFDEADSALGFPLSRLCFRGPEEELRQTANAQPAIMTMSIACLRATAEMKEQAGVPLHPVFVAGHSLGEYTALVAARVLDFGDGVCLDACCVAGIQGPIARALAGRIGNDNIGIKDPSQVYDAQEDQQQNRQEHG